MFYSMLRGLALNSEVGMFYFHLVFRSIICRGLLIVLPFLIFGEIVGAPRLSLTNGSTKGRDTGWKWE